MQMNCIFQRNFPKVFFFQKKGWYSFAFDLNPNFAKARELFHTHAIIQTLLAVKQFLALHKSN